MVTTFLKTRHLSKRLALIKFSRSSVNYVRMITAREGNVVVPLILLRKIKRVDVTLKINYSSFDENTCVKLEANCRNVKNNRQLFMFIILIELYPSSYKSRTL